MNTKNNLYRLVLILAFVMVFVAPLPADGQTEPPPPPPVQEGSEEAIESTTAHATQSDSTIEAVVGGQAVDDADLRGQARFEEFRDITDEVVLDFARINFASANGASDFSFTAIDAGQDDERYFVDFWIPGRMTFRAGYVESLRTYSTGSRTLFSGIGTANLTIPESFRTGAEAAAGAPNAPFASPALISYMENALGHATVFDIGHGRKDLGAAFDYQLGGGLTLSLTGRNERRDGTRPLGFGTYIRRQGLANTPGTGAGNFWRETVEARGVELIEPLDYTTNEFGATLTWARNGNSASAGVVASEFENDITSLYFDNPFEASPGRASAITFDPKAEQEPGAPNGNNNLRGLFARSSMQLAPNNEYTRAFATVSLKLPMSSRLNATVARGEMTQNDPFMPYAENPFVVYSGVAGQPGVVYAHDAPLPQASLDGKMETTQADIRLTSRISRSLNLRGGFRLYELDDQRPSILFPGFSSSGDSYFRPGIGQRDANGNRVLFNEIGGYDRQRLNIGAAYRIGRITLDAEAVRTEIDYDHRQVEGTSENSYRATVRVPVGGGNINVFYLLADRDYSGDWHVGLETSGVRAYDVWKRDRNQWGADYETSIGENLTANVGASFLKDDYPGAVEGFAFGWGLQDSASSSVFAGTHYSIGNMSFGGTVGVDHYEINSLQVTKTSMTTDYNPINRWTRESTDRVFWVGLEALVPFSEKLRWNTAVDYQRFKGEWNTTNLATPDVNSAVAYEFPEISDRTISARTSLLWDMSNRFSLEFRYLYEPYRLNDFTVDSMQPYMQGSLGETRSNPNDVGPMNVSRFLFLDSRYSDYDAQIASLMLHVDF
jgi:hypothetical protein